MMKVWYDIKVEGVCHGPSEFEIREEDFEAAETYMKDHYPKEIAQDREFAGREIIIRPMYKNDDGELKYRDWFEKK